MRTISVGDHGQVAGPTIAVMREFQHELLVPGLGWSSSLIERVEPDQHDPAVWELSGFAADVTSSGGRVLALSDGTLELLVAILKFARDRGIERLLLVTSIGIERLLLRARLAVHRLVPPAHIEGSLCVALFIEVAASLQQLTLAPSHECRSSATGILPAVLEM